MCPLCTVYTVHTVYVHTTYSVHTMCSVYVVYTVYKCATMHCMYTPCIVLILLQVSSVYTLCCDIHTPKKKPHTASTLQRLLHLSITARHEHCHPQTGTVLKGAHSYLLLDRPETARAADEDQHASPMRSGLIPGDHLHTAAETGVAHWMTDTSTTEGDKSRESGINMHTLLYIKQPIRAYRMNSAGALLT